MNPHKPLFRRHILPGLIREVGEAKKTLPHITAVSVGPHESGDVVKYLSVKRGAGAAKQTNKPFNLDTTNGGAREREIAREMVDSA